MANMDTDSFGEYDKMDEQPDTDKTIPFTPGGVIQSWEPECEKHHLEEGKLSQLDSKKHGSKGCIESYPKAGAKPQKHSVSTISKLGMGNCTTKERACH